MNPISALSLAASPELRQDLAGRIAQAGARGIPQAELARLPGAQAADGIAGTNAPSNTFANVLGSLVQDVSAKQSVASEAVQGLLAGQDVSLHQAMIAMEEANVSFQLMVEVRNKLLESYQELMRMQV